MPYNHCPPDIVRAIDTYEADIKAGRIKFAGKFAEDYPGKTKTDQDLGDFVASHVTTED